MALIVKPDGRAKEPSIMLTPTLKTKHINTVHGNLPLKRIQEESPHAAKAKWRTRSLGGGAGGGWKCWW